MCNITLTRHKKCILSTNIGLPECRIIFLFDIRGSSFLLRVAATMISKSFVKLGIVVYYTIW